MKKKDYYDEYKTERNIHIVIATVGVLLLCSVCLGLVLQKKAVINKPLEERIVQRFESLEYIGTSSNKKNKTERSYGSIVNSMMEEPINQYDSEEPLVYEIHLLSDEYQVEGIKSGVAIKYGDTKWFVITDQIVAYADAYCGPAALKFFER